MQECLNVIAVAAPKTEREPLPRTPKQRIFIIQGASSSSSRIHIVHPANTAHNAHRERRKKDSYKSSRILAQDRVPAADPRAGNVGNLADRG